MWDGRLGCIDIAKHCTELIPSDVFLINSGPYSAGQEERKIKKSGIYKMIGLIAIDPPQPEWAYSIVSGPKKRVPYDLHRLQKAEWFSCQDTLPNSEIGQVFRLDRQRACIHDAGRQL